jgi:hypothetical protein
VAIANFRSARSAQCSHPQLTLPQIATNHMAELEQQLDYECDFWSPRGYQTPAQIGASIFGTTCFWSSVEMSTSTTT